jgi:hypothetical protein
MTLKPVCSVTMQFSLTITPGVDLDTDVKSFSVDKPLSSPKVTDFKSLKSVPSTLYLVEEMRRRGRLDTRFRSDSVYVFIGGAAKKTAYFSVAPVVSKSEGPRTHLTPATFAREEGGDSVLKLLDLIGAPPNHPLRLAGFQRSEITLLSFAEKGSTAELTFESEIALFRYPWGEVTQQLPTPPLPDPGEGPEHGLLLGALGRRWDTSTAAGLPSDPAIWESLEQLDTLMRGQKQRILIRGEPGSGKEVFAQALHHGAKRAKDGKDGLVARSVAAMTPMDLRALLAGTDVSGARLPGLIQKAEGGTLFLDEFDKVSDKAAYSDLLRVLESGEFVPVNGAEVIKFKDVNWVFAGAFSERPKAATEAPDSKTEASSMTEADLPKDFWSRLTGQIKIKNPISMEPAADAKNPPNSYAGALLVMFLLQEAMKFAGGPLALTTTPKKSASAAIAAGLWAEKNATELQPNHEIIKCLLDPFEKAITGGRYADRGMGEWARAKPTDGPDVLRYDSVRSIRQAALAAWNHAINEAFKEEHLWDGDKMRTAVREEILRRAGVVASTIVMDMRPGRIKN